MYVVFVVMPKRCNYDDRDSTSGRRGNYFNNLSLRNTTFKVCSTGCRISRGELRETFVSFGYRTWQQLVLIVHDSLCDGRNFEGVFTLSETVMTTRANVVVPYSYVDVTTPIWFLSPLSNMSGMTVMNELSRRACVGEKHRQKWVTGIIIRRMEGAGGEVGDTV